MNSSRPGFGIFALLLFAAAISYGQDTLISFKSESRLHMENPWLSSENMAGSVFSPFLTDGVFTLTTNHRKGDLTLSQLSPDQREYGFRAEKSIRLEDMTFGGGVGYHNLKEENVGWTARMNPATNNPYLLADSIYGLYVKDYVRLNASMGYSLNNRLAFGLNTVYLVGDGARIKDPRPVNDLFSLDIYPSAIFSAKKFKVGANLHLMKGREEIQYTTIENSTTYRFFRFFGLGKGAKTKNGWSHYRNYYNSGIGGELQSEFSFRNLQVFTGLGYFSTREIAEDGSSIPEKGDAGDYLESQIRFYTLINRKGSLLHSGKIFLNLSLGEGIEFLQEPYSLDNITYYRTIAELSKYSLFSLNPGVHYKLAKPHTPFLNKWELQAGVEMDIMNDEYLLEAKRSLTNLIASLEYKHSFFHKKNHWMGGLNGHFSYNLDSDLSQIRTYNQPQELAAWEHIIYPDFLMLTGTSFSLDANLRYGREVNIFKNFTSLVFAALNAGYYSAMNEAWSEPKSFEMYCLKLGLTF
jgi:hypothetical protein